MVKWPHYSGCGIRRGENSPTLYCPNFGEGEGVGVEILIRLGEGAIEGENGPTDKTGGMRGGERIY